MALAPITPQALKDTGRVATLPLAGTELAVVWQANKLVAVEVGELGGGSQSRTTATITTASLAAQAAETGTVVLAKGYRLLTITTDKPCRVRLYVTETKRDDDLNRSAVTPLPQGSSLMLEFISTASLLSADLTPTVDGFSAVGTVYYTVQNLSASTGVVTVDFDYLPTEV